MDKPDLNPFDFQFDDLIKEQELAAEDIKQGFRWLATREEFKSSLKWLQIQAGTPIGFKSEHGYHSYYAGINDTFKLFVDLLKEKNYGR